MITIQSKFASSPQSLCEYQATKDGRYGWLLCTSHPEKSHELEEIQTEIKLEIMNSKVLEISKMEVESWLKDFFKEFHWKLHASLRKTELREKGISLFFGVVFDDEIYFVQFGRIFCAETKGKKLNYVGKSWKNYQIQSMADLSLFGLSEEDIRIKVQHLDLAENENLMVLPGGIATKVFESGTDVGSLLPLIESFGGAENALWMVVKNTPQLQKKKKRKLNKVQISSLVLLIATVLAVIYMAFGNRIIDVLLHRAKKEVSTGQMKSLATEVKEKIGEVVNSPARSIEMNIQWSAELPYVITAAPTFNQQFLYLANETKLNAYNKKDQSLFWEKTYEAPIVCVSATDTGLEMCLDNDVMLGLDFNGNELWRQTLDTNLSDRAHLHMIEITENQDKRIDRSISVVPLERGISVLDSQKGTIMSELQLKDKLRFLSVYDDYDFCFYAVVANSIICIEMQIAN